MIQINRGYFELLFRNSSLSEGLLKRILRKTSRTNEVIKQEYENAKKLAVQEREAYITLKRQWRAFIHKHTGDIVYVKDLYGIRQVQVIGPSFYPEKNSSGNRTKKVGYVRIVDNSFPHLAKQRYSILFNAATASEPYNPKRIKLKPFGNSPIYVRNVDFRELHIENPYKDLVD